MVSSMNAQPVATVAASPKDRSLGWGLLVFSVGAVWSAFAFLVPLASLDFAGYSGGGKLAGGHIAIGGVIAIAIFLLCIVAPLIRRTRQGYNNAAKLSVAIFITLMFSAGTSEVFSPASALIFQSVGFGVMIGLIPVAAVWTFIQSVTKDPMTEGPHLLRVTERSTLGEIMKPGN